jgi:hypothetical protein
MRKGHEPALFFPHIEAEKLSDVAIGFNLSSDHCAEHEWGIKGLKRECLT